uniref:F-box associated beta-propeller type 3 domain-containing protein n=1 Tax=Aegilops tauschii TaxID=37682 RepID=M8C3Q6_AEGTA
MDGRILRVVEAAGDLWTIFSGPDGPVCPPRHYKVLNLIDMTTGIVLRTCTWMDYGDYTFGIGYAARSSMYKMVCIMNSTLGQHTCTVLTLEDDEARIWRKVQSPPTTADGRCHQNCVATIDGAVYFLYGSANEVLCFDLESEEWKGTIKGPARSGGELPQKFRMVELDGALCIVHLVGRQTSRRHTTIWLMSDSARGTWVKMYTIPMLPSMDFVRPLRMIRRDGKLLFYCFHFGEATPSLELYDPFNGTCTHLAKHPRNLLGDVGVWGLHLKCFVSAKISPVATPDESLISFIKDLFDKPKPHESLISFIKDFFE